MLTDSPVLNHHFYPLDAASAHMYWVQQEGFPAVINHEFPGCRKLVTACCTGLGGGGALGSCPSMSVLQ
jgi:hypothetical protein